MTTNEQLKTLDELMAESGDPAITAFLVYQTPDGQWIADGDLKKNLTLDRQATLDDMLGGTAAVHSGCVSQQTAMNTVMFMEQRAAMAAQYARQQQEAAKISSLIDSSKLRNPNA